MYNWLLFIHVLAAITWVGSSILFQILAVRAMGGSIDRQLMFLGDVEWVGTKILMPTSIIVLLAGIGLVAEGGWGFGSLWILLALAGYAATFITGAFFLGPESGRLKDLVNQSGADNPEVAERIKKIFMISRIDLVVLILVVADMTLKPGV